MSWIATSGGGWTAGVDWSTGAAPTASEAAVVDEAGTYAITLATR